MTAAEWAEQCQGLGCDMNQGVDFAAFESLFLEYGRDVVADFTLIFPLTDFRKMHGKSLMRFGLLLSHLYA